MSIKPVDTVRTADSMDANDREGSEGRWLDVPRLQAQNPAALSQSSFWDGRAAAAMVYDYFCKIDKKDSEYIGHDDGDKGPGANGIKQNLRWLGGSNKGKLAGIDESGKVDVQSVFTSAGFKVDGGNFVKPNEQVNPEMAERRLAPLIDQLKVNNPVLLFTALSKGEGGHIVVVSGYKKTKSGELWLRITDPDAPRKDYLASSMKPVTMPAGPEAAFSEYWIQAAVLFKAHPTQPPKRFYSYTGNWGRYLHVVRDAPVPDTCELVHKLSQGASGEAAESAAPAPAAAPAAAKSDSPAAPADKKADAPAAAAPAAGEEKKPEEKKAAAPAADSGKSADEIEPDVIAGDYKDAGAWSGGKFANADLQKVLKKYCDEDGVDPAAMEEGHSASKKGGGDLEVTANEDLPKWYAKWRVDVANKAKFDKAAEGRSRVGEAFSRWFFRDLCKKNNAPYPLSADEFFANLWHSTANGRSKDMGGPSGIYCAAASSFGLERYLNGAGYKMTGGKVGTMICTTIGMPKIAKYKCQPGDVLSIVSAGTPRTGHVVTVICSIAEDTQSGIIWVVSGNCGPHGNVAVDIIHLEPKDPNFSPFKPGDDGKTPSTKWFPDDKKPSAGKIWVYAAQLGSAFMPDKIGSMDDAALTKAHLKKVEPKETPGSKPGKIKQDAPADDGKGSGAPPAADGKTSGAGAKSGGADAKSGGSDAKSGGADAKSGGAGDAKGGAAGDPPAPAKPPSPKPKNDGPPPPAALPPKTGTPRLPIAIDGSLQITGEALTGLYHQAERGNGGYFPLGDAGLFHCGVHLMPESDVECYAIADGEMVAARLGMGPGQHPWGDTGFVITRHAVKGDKNVYNLFFHLKKETLHPDRTESGWLKRLLIAAAGGNPPQKTKWRVLQQLPTWADEDKGKFSPTTVKNDKLLDAAVYEEEDQLFLDHKHYVKLKGMWVRGSGGAGDEERIKEMSPWSSFDLETACKNSALVKTLNEGKTAVFDTDKDKDGKRKWKVDAGEPVGIVGKYHDAPALHWSIFSKDAVYPTGSLLDEEWGAADEVKLKELDLASKDAGTPDQGKALVEALDPDKKLFGIEKDESIVQPVEIRKFYRTPTLSWRNRYQSVKALSDFKLDVDKLVGQDKYKSHTEDEKTDFKTNSKPLVFWDDLSAAEDFPTDGKAVFVHPVTGIRLMTSVAVAQDHDDPKELPGGIDRLHGDEDVVVSMRDKSGPMAAVKITIKGDGKTIKQGETDSAGELIVQLEDLAGHDVEVSVDESILGKDGQLATLVNETGGPVKMTPGDAPGNQTFNGKDVVPDPKLTLSMRVKKGAKAVVYQSWNATTFKPEQPGAAAGLPEGRAVVAERFVFRRDDGKFEAIETHVDGALAYVWSIEDGTVNLEPEPVKTGSGDHKDPAIHATWSQRVAHVNEHPMLAGRVENIDEGKELAATFFAIQAMDGPEHDVELETKKFKIAAGGLAIAFDPGQLIHGQNLLNSPRPVYCKVKDGDHVISLRDQAVTIYAADVPFPDPKSPPPAADKGDGHPVVAVFQIDRGGLQGMTLWDGSPAATRKLKDIAEPAKHRFSGDGGADEIYVGAVTTMPHLPTEAEARMTPAAALAHHQKTTLAAEPDAPAWVFAAPARAALSDNGIASGLCASHCKTAVCAEGQHTGCTEEIRVKNLSACHLAHHGGCQTAVDPIQIGKPPVVKGCGETPGACGETGHDKSKCFVADPVLGAGAEDRERWSVALPLRVKNDKEYPYKGNLRVLLINPLNGKAVVASQELRGPGANCESNDAAEHASVKQDEFKGKGRIAACSYEVYWRLGLSRATGNDGVVLLAFVPASVALGPVPDDRVFQLKKSASHDDLVSGNVVPDKLEPPKLPPKKTGGTKDDANAGPPPATPPPKQPVPKLQPAPAEAAPPPAQGDGKKLAQLRQKMVDVAKAEVGQVDDRGGEGGKRKGWEHLKDYLEKALGVDAEKQGWLPALQKPNGRAGGLHWCGIFGVWCAIQCGIEVKWAFGSGPKGLGKYRTDKKYVPGDILVCKGALNHHCVLTAIAPDGKLETVNGNSFYQSVALAMRDPGEIALYYKLTDQDYEG